MTFSPLKKNNLHSYNETFSKALQQLNEDQRQAVDTIEGPVLVVAGPGTGKTQLLAARIGNILRKTDATASNILCLTFTDAGAVAMRKRLLDFIGPEAYNVSIFTFHAFCNKVISENIEYFGGYYDLKAVSELEQKEIYRKIIDELPDDHELKRLKGGIYYEIRRLSNLFDLMKREGWTAEYIDECIEKEKETLRNDPDMYYKRNGKGYKKGDFKQKTFDQNVSKFEKLKAGAFLFDRYNALLKESARFDFNDMILWVSAKFIEEPDLLLQYQERYQYFLVDEYQDTNGSQNKLLEQLAGYWENPNLFVVGDDDQSIFRFQGANMENIIEFKEKYNPELVILRKNYRSAQEILDHATDLIEQNQQRLATQYQSEIVKSLSEGRSNATIIQEPRVQVLAYPNIAQEELGIAQEIFRLYESGENLSEVAIIYRSHKNVANLVKYLELKGIPLNIKKRINVLDTHEINRIITLFTYIDQESTNIDQSYDLLFEIFHYEYFHLSPRDIGLIALEAGRKRRENPEISWHSFLMNRKTLEEIGVRDPARIIAVYDKIREWIADSKNYTIQVLVEKILTEGNIIQTIMHSPEKVWRIQILNTFFDFIKDENTKDPGLTLSKLLSIFALMKEESIALPYEKIISNANGVNFMTAHGSKGLEFKYVFLIRCDKSNWESTGNQFHYAYPNALTSSSKDDMEEDERRLFFVAMTRAKDVLKMSYPELDGNEKNLEPVKFLVEVKNPAEFKNIEVEENALIEYRADLMRFEQGSVVLIEHELIDRVLENFSMSVTNLNKYLACPLRFYFESILRIPMARNANMGFGRAMHKAMELLFRKIQQKSIPSLEQFFDYFELGMEESRSHFTPKEFKDLSTYGKNCLEAYFQKYSSTWSFDYTYLQEYKIRGVAHKNIPLTGVLDKITIMNDLVIVTDYKTGNYTYASKKLKPPLGDQDIGGDYWRQIVFYKILLDADPLFPGKMSAGVMDFLEPDSNDGVLRQAAFEVEDFEIEIVSKQLEETYEKIRNHEFEKGCNDDQCKWCNFVKQNFALGLNEEDLEEEA